MHRAGAHANRVPTIRPHTQPLTVLAGNRSQGHKFVSKNSTAGRWVVPSYSRRQKPLVSPWCLVTMAMGTHEKPKLTCDPATNLNMSMHCCTVALLTPNHREGWQTETPVVMGISIYIYLEPYSRMQECKSALMHTTALLTALLTYIAASIASGSITGSSANCSLVPQCQWCPIFRT